MIKRILFILLISYAITESCTAQSQAKDSVLASKIHGYQIHLLKPVKEIRLLMYEKNFLPVQGRLWEDRKQIIMNSYEPGNKIHVKVIYEDGTADDFVRSPCYIDPVIDAL